MTLIRHSPWGYAQVAMRAKAALFVVGLLVATACSTYRESLNRGQRFYDENEFESALAIWRYLENDMDALEVNDQARYAYLRGMTDYRLDFRADARHWLAISKAIDQVHPGALTPDWKRRLEEALADLNKDVFGGAAPTESAPVAPPADGGTSAAASPAGSTSPAAPSAAPAATGGTPPTSSP